MTTSKRKFYTQITVPPIFAGIIFSLYIFAGPNLFPQVDISGYMHCLRFDFHFARRLLLRQYRWWVTHYSLTASGGWLLFFFTLGSAAIVREMRRGWIQLGRSQCDYLDTGRITGRGAEFFFFLFFFLFSIYQKSLLLLLDTMETPIFTKLFVYVRCGGWTYAVLAAIRSRAG